MYTVSLTQIVEKFHLKNLTPGVDLTKRKITLPETNRPALQLAGFYTYFDHERVQLIGMVEHAYLCSVSPEMRQRIFERLFSTNIPCLIFCRDIDPFTNEGIPEMAEKAGVALFVHHEATAAFSAQMMRFLALELAPRVSLHGVMMDCFGEGVLIMGESGLGKSETALELIERGHRLVSDDIVEVRKVSDTELIARGADLIQNLIELRGIGVINVKELYGVQSIRLSKLIDVVIKLEEWKPESKYDRIGLEQETTEILGNTLSCYSIPIMAGRNLAMIIECAALNHRQKKMGYNAAEELRDRVNANIKRRQQERELRSK